MTVYTVAYGGERLDRIAKKLMRTERLGTVEAILDANPGVADLIVDGLVPAGTALVVPEGFQAARQAAYTLAWE